MSTDNENSDKLGAIKSRIGRAHEITKIISDFITFTIIVISVISVILGALLYYSFIHSFDLVDVIYGIDIFETLFSRFTLGAFIIVLSLLISFILTPTIIYLTIVSLLEIKEKEGKSVEEFNLSNFPYKLFCLWTIAFFLPPTLIVSALLFCNLPLQCILLIVSIIVTITVGWILYEYQNQLDLKTNPAEKFTFIAPIVISLIVTIFLLLIFIPIINSSNIPHKTYILFFCFLFYSIVYSLIIIRNTIYKKRSWLNSLGFISIGATLVIVLLTFINPQGFLKASMRIVGISDMQKQNLYYQYRFKTNDITDELKQFEHDSYTQSNGHTYINGYALFKYKGNLILCTNKPNNNDTENKKETCVNMSNIEYRRYTIDKTDENNK